MEREIKTRNLGHLRIYIEPSHKVRHGDRSLFRKLFPKTAYLHILKEARKDGIINATAHHVQTSYTGEGKIASFTAEGDNSQLAMVVELIGKRDRLETFFRKHNDLLKGKVVIYKEVECWDIE